MLTYPSETRPRLTVTELKILRLIASGRTSQEVADAFEISKRTVDFHLGNVYDKLDVHNRLQAANKARRLGLFE